MCERFNIPIIIGTFGSHQHIKPVVEPYHDKPPTHTHKEINTHIQSITFYSLLFKPVQKL